MHANGSNYKAGSATTWGVQTQPVQSPAPHVFPLQARTDQNIQAHSRSPDGRIPLQYHLHSKSFRKRFLFFGEFIYDTIKEGVAYG